MLNHQTHWTVEIITQRLEQIRPMVYRRKAPITGFRYLPLDSSSAGQSTVATALVQPGLDDSSWSALTPLVHRGSW